MSIHKKIMIIDDHPMNVEIIREVLEEHYDVVSSLNPAEGLQKAAIFRPDVLLLDIMMPGMDGFEVCRRLREDEAHQDLKIIMVSARSEISERLKAYQMGADDYLTKPFDNEELLAKLRVFTRLKSVEETDRIKSDALALLSHETCTPLTGILSSAQLLMQDSSMSGVDRRMLAEMNYQGALRLREFFSRLSLLTNLKEGKISLQKIHVDLAQLVKTVLDSFGERLQQAQLDLRTEIQGSCKVEADPDRLKPVIGEILENAIQHSSEGSSIEIVLRCAGKHTSLSIQDHGPGIEEQDLSSLFQPLFNADIMHHTRGHGLSLAIAWEVVRAHGGTITASSRKGEGMMITIFMPKAQYEPGDCSEDFLQDSLQV